MSQKHALSHIISFAGNYRLFAHSDVSYRFNGESDNVVLEYNIIQQRRYAFTFCLFEMLLSAVNYNESESSVVLQSDSTFLSGNSMKTANINN